MQSLLITVLIRLCFSSIAADQSISPMYGRIVTIGDSMFSSHKRTYVTTLGALLNTTVVAHVRSGADVDSISAFPACSADAECKWSVINDASGSVWKEAGWLGKFERLVDREVDAGKRVIIHGHPVHQHLLQKEPDHGILFDKYADMASTRDHVWFVDPREIPVWQADWSYYASDKRHPSAKAVKVIAANIATVIMKHSMSTTIVTATGPTTTTTTTTVAPTTSLATTTTTTRVGVSIWNVGGDSCLKSDGKGRLLKQHGDGSCAKFTIAGKAFRSADEQGACLDWFSREGWGLWSCHGGKNQQLVADGTLKWCSGSNCVIEKEPAGALFSGDSISLLAHTGKHIEVQGDSVGARWNDHGRWQTFTIEGYGGRAIYAGDLVSIKAHNGALLTVQGIVVQATKEANGKSEMFTIHKRHGENGPVFPGDAIFLRSHTGRNVDVQGDAVQARWFESGPWQTLVIERVAGASRRLAEASDGEQRSTFFVV